MNVELVNSTVYGFDQVFTTPGAQIKFAGRLNDYYLAKQGMTPSSRCIRMKRDQIQA